MKLLLGLVLGLCGLAAADNQWVYRGEHGLDDWAKEFPNCAGKKQSPIDLDPFSSTLATFEPFSFSHYHEVPTEAIITNNGHSLEVKVKAANQPEVSGGNLGGAYTFAQYHIHWGADDLRGSEHTVNSVRFPMEQHLVHYKTEYCNLSSALEKPDGVAVLGILYVISENDNPALAPIIAQVQASHEVAEHTMTTNLYPLTSVLPKDLSRFYRYPGSLTTPTCNEVVTWTIFDEHVSISENQMKTIRALYDAKHDPLVNNFRPTQPLNGRKLYRSFAK